MKKKTVYWTDEWRFSVVTPMLNILPIEGALSQMDFSKESQIAMCPAFRDYYKNTMVITSPLDMKISVNDQSLWSVDIHSVANENVQEFFNLRDESLFSICTSHFFWSETSMQVEQLHPTWMRGDVAQKSQSVSGTFDISKWFRPLQPTIRLTEGVLDIKRGDPLFVARIVCKDDVEFKRFAMSPKLESVVMETMKASKSTTNFFRSIQNYYDIFKNRQTAKTITSEIKANLY